MNDLQRYAVLKAVEKEVKSEMERLRKGIDADMLRAYQETGVDRIRVQINGKSIGTLSARLSHPTVARHLTITDEDAALASICSEDGREAIRDMMHGREWAALESHLLERMVTDGIALDGLDLVEFPQPESFVGTMMRGCKMADVIDALGPGLDSAIHDALALPGGE